MHRSKMAPEFFCDWLNFHTFSTNVVSRRKKDRPQPQDQFTEEASLCVLEDFHPFQSVQVNVNGDFALQLIWQATNGFFLVRRFLSEPQVIKPFDDLVLEAVWHPTQAHVCFHAIQFGCNHISAEHRSICIIYYHTYSPLINKTDIQDEFEIEIYLGVMYNS